ncbi:MAG: response regulator transcription factor [Ruminococcus sp.]|nr:response regulator transcription factor [Ruminococcus sp.]
MYKIFITEDDRALAEALCRTLSAWGYEVKAAERFENIVPEFREFEPHLVLMDVSLPFCDGFHWCAEIRKISKVPIVFLSSAADDMNIVMAMNMGGDDFIAKPVDPKVLTAKIGAVLRRCYDMAEVTSLSHKGVTLDLAGTAVSYQEKTAELTKNELKILELLMENKGKTVSRDALMVKLWQMDCYVEENTLTVNITRLRRKLSELGITDFIKTRVGMGYIIEE